MYSRLVKNGFVAKEFALNLGGQFEGKTEMCQIFHDFKIKSCRCVVCLAAAHVAVLAVFLALLLEGFIFGNMQCVENINIFKFCKGKAHHI